MGHTPIPRFVIRLSLANICFPVSVSFYLCLFIFVPCLCPQLYPCLYPFLVPPVMVALLFTKKKHFVKERCSGAFNLRPLF